MSRAAGYSARWHLLNGRPVPKGEPLDYVLAALEPTLGKLPNEMERDEDSTAPATGPVEAPPAPVLKVYREIPHVTPNMGGTMTPQGIVLHSTYGNVNGSLSWIKNARSRVSYHTLIFEDGTRHNVVPFNRVAWHAGASTFRGRSGCNSFMAGIAFGGNLYTRDLTEDEIESCVEICARLAKRYSFGLEWITDHRTVSPGRKEDIPPAVLAMLKSRIASAL